MLINGKTGGMLGQLAAAGTNATPEAVAVALLENFDRLRFQQKVTNHPGNLACTASSITQKPC